MDEGNEIEILYAENLMKNDDDCQDSTTQDGDGQEQDEDATDVNHTKLDHNDLYDEESLYIEEYNQYFYRGMRNNAS